MENNAAIIRIMQPGDFEAVVAIDEKVTRAPRREYYEMKFDKLVKSKDYVPTSLVAEAENGKVIGFIIGELYIGEYGIYQEKATLDTIGVDPDYQGRGIGEQLITELIDHLKRLGVEKVNTLVGWDDFELIHFFSVNKFVPSTTINLERSI
jgi:predicted N-acetyltransferase YhbS